MPITLQQLEDYARREGLVVFTAKERAAMQFTVRGVSGQHVVIAHLEDGGDFLQFCTVNFLRCPADHPHLPLVLQVLAELNRRRRLVKFGWNAEDGEVTVFADAWVMDGALTPAQFSRMLHSFIPTLELAHSRLQVVLTTGADPGEADPVELLVQLGGKPALPSPLTPPSEGAEITEL